CSLPFRVVHCFSFQPRLPMSSRVATNEPRRTKVAKIFLTCSASASFTIKRRVCGSGSYPNTGSPPVHFPFRRAADCLSRVRSLMILGVQEASQACDVSHPDVMRMRRRGPCRPVHDGGNADMFIAPISSESGECTEIHRQVVKLVPEGLAKRDIAF